MRAAKSGDLVLAGSLGQPDDGTALLLFDVTSAEAVEAFATADPYVTGGIVSRWSVRTWKLIVGADRPLSQR